MTPELMTFQNNNLIFAAPGFQIPQLWSPVAASCLASPFGTCETIGFVPSAAYPLGRVTKNAPAPPIAFAMSHQERCS